MEDLTLLLLRDNNETAMWLDRWAISYPTVQTAKISDSQSIAQWQNTVEAAFAHCGQHKVMLVAHGVAANAVAAWYYQTDTVTQQRIVGIILVAPIQKACGNDMVHTFTRVRFNCKAALVIGENDPLCTTDWAKEHAQLWRARLFVLPNGTRLNHFQDGWQWGMKLMQEMLLS